MTTGWYRPGYGKPVAMKGPGGMVTVHSTPVGAGKPASRRVSVAPAFDPDATSMTPVPGWTAAAAASTGRVLDWPDLPAMAA
jgi:hypothetical protein